MKYLRIKSFVACLFTALTLSQLAYIQAGEAKSVAMPSEAEMREYLKFDAEEVYSCIAKPLHYIDLEVTLHTIDAVEPVDGRYEQRSFTATELVHLKRLVGSFPEFKITQANQYSFWFEVVPGTQPLDVLSSFYRLKAVLARHHLFFIKSSAPCPGTTSVNNL